MTTDTTPPPSPEAKALRAIGSNLDALGELATDHAAQLGTLREMGDDDARALARIEIKIDQVLGVLRSLADRTAELEGWRGDHERAHVRQ